ncbi:hypothetical protein BDW74DRAFT_182345 [Aspergillus multicolor]|uniref:uncharacterized protein n=1 Tax=Aspergillus multicolor TaxID=41759 RepID=UPI003CCC9679
MARYTTSLILCLSTDSAVVVLTNSMASTTQRFDLRLAPQGLRGHRSWPLTHYRHTTFSWLMDRDECVKRARFAVALEGLYMFEFVEEDGEIVALRWGHEAGIEPEVFRKKQSDRGDDRHDPGQGGYGAQIPLSAL